MKTRNLAAGLLLACLTSGCYLEKYLPDAKLLDVSPYGSYMKVTRLEGEPVIGELLAIDTNRIVILYWDRDTVFPIQVPASEIKKVKLRYARPVNYFWSIPVYTLACISHGWYMLISIPVNIVATTLISVGGLEAYTYNEKKMPRSEFSKFARYPEGIPPGLDLNTLRRPEGTTRRPRN